jgi:hypothetical protein
MKIHPMGGELFPADGQTDTTKLIVGFGNFVKVIKNAGSQFLQYLGTYVPIYTTSHLTRALYSQRRHSRDSETFISQEATQLSQLLSWPLAVVAKLLAQPPS